MQIERFEENFEVMRQHMNQVSVFDLYSKSVLAFLFRMLLTHCLLS